MFLPCATSLLFGTLQLAAVVHAKGTLTTGSSYVGSQPEDNLGHRYVGAQVEDNRSGVGIVGDYEGLFRPQVHFTPPQYFLNDPNGMFRDDKGIWHLYYQYNPGDVLPGLEHWGHATSPDLYHWTNQPVALFPTEKKRPFFSGSCVVDKNNTSGLFPNQTNGVVAIYTIGDYRKSSAGIQQQAMAYSLDNGFTFIPYQHNPIMPSNLAEFRDPKVFWYEDHWVMTLVFADLFIVGIYTSHNLIDWTHASNFTGNGIYNLQWECPNLIRTPHRDSQGNKIGDLWLLMIGINPRAQLGGSGTVYHTGTFNGTHFEAHQPVPRLADMGKDNYAGQFFYGQGDDEDPIYIGWASNWQYTMEVPTDSEGWRGLTTLPRQVHIGKSYTDWNLFQQPYDLTPVMGETLLSGKLPINGSTTVDFSHLYSGAIYWEVNVTGIPTDKLEKNISFDFSIMSPNTGEYIRGGHTFGGYNDFYLDRGGARGFDDVYFADKTSTNSYAVNGTWSMSGVLDRSTIEVFLNGGMDSGTLSYYITSPLNVINFRTAHFLPGMEGTLRVVALESAWEKMKSPDGLVWGNQTKAAPLQI
ncbi:hypothetical protein E4U21_004665 [Claviceps maximensis]|nr:hypothetical protein E4U21_004665 [Claviceps maximensis]